MLNSQLSSDFEFALVVANPQWVTAEITVQRGDAIISMVNLAPGGVITIPLPWVDELKQEFASEHSALVSQGAYQMRSNVPVTAYQFNPLHYQINRDCVDDQQVDNQCFSFTNDASLLLPTHVLTGNYLALSRPSMLLEVADAPAIGSPGFIALIATKDNTHLEITSSAHTLSAGADFPALSPGETASADLNQGDVLQIASAIPNECPSEIVEETTGTTTLRYCDTGSAYDLSGTVIRADSPIAVIAGHNCTFVPFHRWACDHLEEALFPVESWGRSFVLSSTKPLRGEPNLIRVLSAHDENTINFEPTIMQTQTLDRGQFIDIELDDSVQITGSEPLAIAQFLVGQDWFGIGTSGRLGRGDPSMSLAIPAEQYRKEYSFLIPDSYIENYLVITATLGAEITLDGQKINNFSPIGESRVGKLNIEVSAGIHRIEGFFPFGVSVYGFGNYTSYMYPAGLDLRLIGPPI